MTAQPVHIEGMTKSYRGWFGRAEVVAVRDLSLEVARGEVVALVGPNGAGKTTTILSLLGLMRPDRGTLRLFGEPAGSRAAHQRLGFLSEIFYTYPHRRAADLMAFYGRLSSMDEAVLARRVPALLARVGLSDAAERKLRGFSKGMVQRLGLAQALLHEPELLILDEPTTGLDPEGRRLVADVVLEAKARGTAVLLSSHILADVERICDRLVMLHHGRVVLADTVSALVHGADGWEIEIRGWHPDVAAVAERGGATVARRDDAGALLRCGGCARHELLRALLALPVEIDGVRRGGGSLEETYLRQLRENGDA